MKCTICMYVCMYAVDAVDAVDAVYACVSKSLMHAVIQSNPNAQERKTRENGKKTRE